jgi:hypothetical protein
MSTLVLDLYVAIHPILRSCIMRTILSRLLVVVLPLFVLLLAVFAPRLSAVGPAAARLPTFNVRAMVTGSRGFADPGPPVYDSVRQRLYFTYGGYGAARALTAIHAPTGRVVANAGMDFSTHVAVSADGSRVYATTVGRAPTNYNQRVLILDATNFNVLNSFIFDCAEPTHCSAGDLYVGPAGRLYMAADSAVDVRDPTTGALLHRLTFAADVESLQSMVVHGDKLFVAETGHGITNPDPKLHRYDISDVTPVLELSVPLPAGQSGPDRVSTSGSYLIGGNTLYSPVTLQAIHTFSGSFYLNITVSYDEERFILTYGDMYDMRLREHDIATDELKREADLRLYEGRAIPMEGLFALPNGEVAAIFSDVVRIFSPADYATLLPVAFANYCSAPFLDDFSDPNSGWPVGDTGRTIYRYDNAQYSIFQREADIWSAVSRGDSWDETWRVAGVKTRVPAKSGMLGIVFGLNADWSYFYTFEIIPDERRWVFFRYSNGRWELLDTGISGSINPAGEYNALALRTYNGQVALEVNRNQMTTVPAIPPGRIALSAGSFEPGVDLRFDDYYFAGPHCPLPEGQATRNARLDVAPPISRPPLETFLP